MIFTYAVSFESDLLPVETIRGEVVASDTEDATRRAVRRAYVARKGRGAYRSLAVVIEKQEG